MKLRKLSMVFLLALSLLSGCQRTRYQVLVSCYPLQYLVEQIAGERVSCELLSENTLIQRAGIAENYKELLNQSDALFYIASLESYYEIYADEINAAGLDKVNIGDQLGSFPFERETITVNNGVESKVSGPYYEGSAFNEVDTYYSDPTLWMDAVTMNGMASYICDYLCERYPAYEQEFQENYAVLEVSLASLDAQYQELKEADIAIAVMTPNFGHLQTYGVQVYPVCLSRYGALPNEEQLAVIRESLLENGVRYMAIENNLPQDMVDLRLQLINELGLIPVSLYNISSLNETQQERGLDYLSLMQENLAILQSIANDPS